MNYLQFVRKNREMVIFGIIMTALSSFGQTFLLALYVPFLMEEFKLSNGLLSTFYGLATIGAAMALPKLRKLIDSVPLQKFTLATTATFVISLLFFSISQAWWYIPLAFFGLRLAGQGLYNHIAITSMSRYFDVNRGKAISLASLGHPLGQAILPAIILVVISKIGWRESLWLNAAVVSIVVTVFTLLVLKSEHLVNESGGESDTGHSEKNVDRVRQRDIMKSKAFWLLAPNIFFIPFAVTGLFFYQFAIIEFKEWNIGLAAAGLTSYAIASSSSILLSGPLIDKYKAKTFFPFYLFPFLVALLVIWLVPNVWGIFLYNILMGFSVGFGSATVAALQVEFFGQTYIGTVRSMFTSIMVLSSAIGPALFGIFLDLGWGFQTIFPVTLGILVLIMIQSFRAMPKYSRAKWKYKYKKVTGKKNKIPKP
ncbi:MFS transporter [Aquiflexum sp. LQ15W]|uniref:MFS transporter n=1 Tax=Cognataquiflexum nitidum TaxID=2922272 RepID=UPI001F135BB3|nr:MFS transporter [Cognataquiflexum nitidum]MCH6201945.1 MFS transporter [Cognataquiflexum nitidum]